MSLDNINEDFANSISILRIPVVTIKTRYIGTITSV